MPVRNAMPVSTSSTPMALLDIAELRAEARQEAPRRARPRTPRAGTECRARANRPPAAPRLSPPSPRTAATARIAARIGPMHGVQPNAKASPSHRRPTGRPACACSSALLAHQPAIARQPEEMQAHDDDGDAGDDRQFVRIGAHSAPITLALAPSATNTVEKPSTNSSAASTSRASTRGCGSPSATAPARCRPDRRDKAAPAAARRATGSSSCPRPARRGWKRREPWRLDATVTAPAQGAARPFARDVITRDAVDSAAVCHCAGGSSHAQSHHRCRRRPRRPCRRRPARLGRHRDHLRRAGGRLDRRARRRAGHARDRRCSTRRSTVERIDAIVLSGGSAFGLDAAARRAGVAARAGPRLCRRRRARADRAGRDPVRPAQRRRQELGPLSALSRARLRAAAAAARTIRARQRRRRSWAPPPSTSRAASARLRR